MSGVADDGAARLDQVMRQHSVVLGSTLARKPSGGRMSREVEVEPDLSPEQDQPKRPVRQEATGQVTSCLQLGKLALGLTVFLPVPGKELLAAG